MQSKRLHVLLNTSIKSKKRETKFKSLDDLKKQLTKETHIKKGGVSSKEEESDDESYAQEYEEDDEE